MNKREIVLYLNELIFIQKHTTPCKWDKLTHTSSHAFTLNRKSKGVPTHLKIPWVIKIHHPSEWPCKKIHSFHTCVIPPKLPRSQLQREPLSTTDAWEGMESCSHTHVTEPSSPWCTKGGSNPLPPWLLNLCTTPHVAPKSFSYLVVDSRIEVHPWQPAEPYTHEWKAT